MSLWITSHVISSRLARALFYTGQKCPLNLSHVFNRAYILLSSLLSFLLFAPLVDVSSQQHLQQRALFSCRMTRAPEHISVALQFMTCSGVYGYMFHARRQLLSAISKSRYR